MHARRSRLLRPLSPGSAAMALALVGLAAIVTACEDRPYEPPPPLGTWVAPVTVETVAMERCDTPPELVDGLSRQLVDAIECLRPGTLADLPLGPDLRMLQAGRPAFIDARAADALAEAAAAGDRQMVVRWAYRDVALQHLFWLQDQFRGCAVAAPAGLSNHQNGLAVDLDDRAYWEPIMRRHGWANDLPNDRVHFDYQVVPDVGLGALSLLAFQALWNANVPGEPLDLTAELDGATYDALSRAPIEGFAAGLCDDGPPPIGPGPVRGPTLGQQAWRGCSPPAELVEGLAAQVTRVMSCLEPDALAPLPVCAEAGCVQVLAPPTLESLGAPAAAALRAASVDVGAPLVIEEALRDVSLARFYDAAAGNIGCRAPAGQAALVTGRAVRIDAPGEVQGALERAGFVGGSGLWVYEGDDGADLDQLAVLAFQRLWNLNRGDDPIDDDGLIGPQTRGALDRAPIAGFEREPCGVVPDPEPDPEPEPEPQPEPEPEPDPEPQPEPEPDPEPQPEPEPGLDAAPEPEPIPDAATPGRDAAPGPFPDAGPDRGAPIPPAPVPGWSGLVPEDEAGCRQSDAPIPAATLGLLLVLAWRRRRRC
ncbi:MAG: hypothetical protein R3F65_03145 [bacterium]